MYDNERNALASVPFLYTFCRIPEKFIQSTSFLLQKQKDLYLLDHFYQRATEPELFTL